MGSTRFFDKGGSQSGSRLFTNTGYGSASGPTIVDEERRLIDKVFAIVDKDNSGHVDTKELKEMFKLFGLESRVFDQTIEKIMNNVDKDFDGTISAAEFYKLLSQKFEKGDPRREIDCVFHKMDKKHDGYLDVEELHEVSQLLGENIPKGEIKEMIKMFSKQYQESIKQWQKAGKKKNEHPKDPEHLTMQDYYDIMQIDLAPGRKAQEE